MSVSKINLFIKTNLPNNEVKSRVGDVTSGRYEQVQLVNNFLKGLENGEESGIVNLEVGFGAGSATSASGTVTISGSGAQSVTINGKSLTGGTDYVIANLTPSQIVLNIVSAISNSQSSRVQSVYADQSSSNSSVANLFAKPSGEVGNLVTLAATGAASASGATLASGVDGLQNILKFNLNS